MPFALHIFMKNNNNKNRKKLTIPHDTISYMLPT